MPTGSALTTTSIYATVDKDMQKRVWGITSPLSTLTSAQKSALTGQVESQLNYLLSSSIEVNGRWWWEGCALTGDSNTDRFVLSEIMYALYQLKQANVLTKDIPGWLASAKVAVDFQYTEYGQKTDFDPSCKLAGSYPNMDAAYTLIMGAAGVLYSNTSYTASGQSFALSLKNIVQSDGTLPYMATTGAAIGYTNLVIDWLGRYLVITADTNARAALVAMKDYFPKQLVAPGISENTSVPWFKHSIEPFVGSPGAIDVIAALASDPRNAYYAQTLCNDGYYDLDDLVVGATYWQPIAAAQPRDMVMAPDVDINGFRGRFGPFAWVGPMNPGADALGGATLTTANVMDYIPNPGFEVLTDTGTADSYSYGVYSGSPVIAVDSTTAHSGKNSVKISGTGSADRGSVGIRFPVIPAHRYQFSFWYKSDTQIAASAIVCRFIAWLDDGSTDADKVTATQTWVSSITGATYGISAGNLQITASNATPGAWSQVSITFTPPSPTVGLSMELFNWLGNGTIWYDDIAMTDLNADGSAIGLRSSFVLATPEIGILNSPDNVPLLDQAAYISPVTYPRTSLVSAWGDFSVLSAQYQPQLPSTPDDSPRDNPGQQWMVNQSWLGLSDRLVGNIKMTSLTAHEDKYVRMRLRTAPGGLLMETDSAHFTAGGLALTLWQNNFTGVSIGPAEITDYYDAPDADEIDLTESGAPRPNSYTAGRSHLVSLDVRPPGASALSSFTTLNSGNFTGFRAATSLSTYDVWFNTSTSSATLSYTLPTSTLQVVNNLYVTGSTAQIVAPTAISGTAVSAAVPANGTACVVQSRNLIANPGLEQWSGTGAPADFTYSAPGNTVIGVDTGTAHSGYNSVKITETGSQRGTLGMPRIAVTAGKKYQVTFWYKTDGSLSASAIVCRLMAFQTTGSAESDKVPWSTSWITGITGGTYQVEGNNLNVTASNSSPGAWNSLTITFTLPSPTIGLSVELFNWQGTGTVWYDDISVIQVS